MGQNGPKWAKMGQKWAKMSPKWAKMGLKWAKKNSKITFFQYFHLFLFFSQNLYLSYYGSLIFAIFIFWFKMLYVYVAFLTVF